MRGGGGGAMDLRVHTRVTQKVRGSARNELAVPKGRERLRPSAPTYTPSFFTPSFGRSTPQ